MNDRKIIDWNPRIRHRRRIHKALILMALFLVTTLQILALPGGAQAQVFNSVGVPMTGPNDRCGEQIWTLEFSVSGPDVRGTFLGIHNPASMNVPTPLGPADCSNPTPDPNRLLVSHYDAAYSTATAIGSLPVPQRGRPWPVPLEATSPGGAPAAYSIPAATDNLDPNPMVVCTPAPSRIFSLGTTPVTCTATDATGNSSTAVFDIVVQDTTPPVMVARRISRRQRQMQMARSLPTRRRRQWIWCMD